METMIKQTEVGDYRITIRYDEGAACPLKDFSMMGCYLWEGKRCGFLSPECNWEEVWGKYGDSRHTLEESLRVLIEEYCDFDLFVKYIKDNNLDNVRMRYDRSERVWNVEVFEYWNHSKVWDLMGNITPEELHGKNWSSFWNLLEYFGKDTLLKLLRECGKDIYVTEWSTTGNGQGDYCNGIAFVTRKRYEDYCGCKNPLWKDAIQKCVNSEVWILGMWMWGDIIGYTLERKVRFNKCYHEDRENEESYEWEEVDSCWGFYTNPDELIATVIDEYNLKEDSVA